MPKRLSPEHIDAMQSARRVTRDQRKAALAALQENPQFTNFKFWRRVDPKLLDQVRDAIDKAAIEIKKQRIRQLEKEIAAIRSR